MADRDAQSDDAWRADADRDFLTYQFLRMAHPWFEDDAEVEAALDALPDAADDAAAEALLDGVLDTRRGIWAERFLLTALWARALKPGQPPALGRGPLAITWGDLAILTREVLSARPLHDIPPMFVIAGRSVSAVRIDGPRPGT